MRICFERDKAGIRRKRHTETTSVSSGMTEELGRKKTSRCVCDLLVSSRKSVSEKILTFLHYA